MKPGKHQGGGVPSLATIFEAQGAFQEKVTGIGPPEDNVQFCSYHIQAMVEELGELMKSDKRWKTHRNTAYDPENKLEEVADCFITMVNISLWSGFSAEEVAAKIVAKIAENTEKLKVAKNVDNR